MIDVCLLGTGGTMPLKSRWLSSALVRHNGKCVLFDCGEGTQIALKCANFTFKPIDVICLTHFHADHVSGLPGMLLSMGNEGREQPVLIIGPRGTRKVVSSLCTIAPGLTFDIEIAELINPDETFYFNGFTITAFKVNHAVSCYGYRLDVPRAGKFDVEKAKANNVPMALWSRLQKEETAEYEGKTYTSDMVLGEKRKGIRFVYSTDTRPTESLYENCMGANLAILEGMYGADEKESHAKIKMHMTFAEAADIASKANAQELWLTHYSPSMPNPQDYISEAQSIFPQTQLGFDGKTKTIYFPE
ncbi:MAG: ribonuclease Z [Clostridia bacterium]|nr:ribonuclease Z [Clostridia bacterium]MBO7289038.1 ribonuclease Z [Clostridia bacterium]